MSTKFFFSLSLVCFFAFNSQTNFAATLATTPLDQIIILRSGEDVSLELAEEVDVTSVYTGNTIDFQVRDNVVVHGKVVISAGTIAEGRITKVSKSCDGKCYAITIEVRNVQAVDGSRVKLRSSPHIMKSNCCDGPAVLDIGTKISAAVLDDTKIDA